MGLGLHQEWCRSLEHLMWGRSECWKELWLLRVRASLLSSVCHINIYIDRLHIEIEIECYVELAMEWSKEAVVWPAPVTDWWSNAEGWAWAWTWYRVSKVRVETGTLLCSLGLPTVELGPTWHRCEHSTPMPIVPMKEELSLEMRSSLAIQTASIPCLTGCWCSKSVGWTQVCLYLIHYVMCMRTIV